MGLGDSRNTSVIEITDIRNTTTSAYDQRQAVDGGSIAASTGGSISIINPDGLEMAETVISLQNALTRDMLTSINHNVDAAASQSNYALQALAGSKESDTSKLVPVLMIVGFGLVALVLGSK